MAYNLGYVDSSGYNLGYSGEYTGGSPSLYPYVFTDHGIADNNSFLKSANFASTQQIDIGVVSDFDSAKITVNWQAISDGQLWRSDINTLDAVTVVSEVDTTDTATLRYRITETGQEGTFTVTVSIQESVVVVDTTPDPFTVTPLTDQPLDSYVEFAPIEVTGVDSGEDIPVTVLGTSVEYAVDAGAGYGGYTSTTTNVQLGYFVKPRIRTATEGSTEVTGGIDIGGESSSLSATTVAAVPQGTTSISNVVTTDTTLTATLAYSGGDSTGFEYSLNGTTWTSTSASVSISGLSPDSFGTLYARAVNATGGGTFATAEFTTDSAPDTTPPTISIADVSTRDLTPTITGFCGDATSITLVVTGVGTYNPTNNQGTFSVQLPELTVGTYEMTLDAEDSLGNASVQQTATLTILEPLPPRGNAFGLRDMNPWMQVVTLVSNDGGACEMDEFGRFTTTNAYSIVDVDMDGIQRKVLVKADGRPIKPFYKVNWQILD